MNFSVTRVQNAIYVLTKHLGLPAYDFEFSNQFYCNHPSCWSSEILAVSRIGATNDYAARYHYFLEYNIRLIHSPEEYQRTSFLPIWYPLIEKYTPRSKWFEEFPEGSEIESDFTYPVFIKGERQTNRHSRAKSIINSRSELDNLRIVWKDDSILHWQRIVVRDFIPLELIVPDDGRSMPKSIEFRTFWWKGHCVSVGNYWTSEAYKVSDLEKEQMLQIAKQVADLINVTFLVVDMAKSLDGQWIVIEVNDGQDAGYAGNNPYFLWNNVLKLEEVV
ncbi:MAG: ATP-grasp domain-containing protein [Leptospiraceae bacterium]|nr:ATP-grasp domain-containing protein [Leptospiraceae bacterium]